jgi:hypothetical protein
MVGESRGVILAVYAESREYAEERFQRIIQRNQYSFGSYRNTANFNSVSNRMTNCTKLWVWAQILRERGWDASADYAEDRLDGLDSGRIVPTRRVPSVTRSTVERYVSIPATHDRYDGPNYVEFEFNVSEYMEEN